MARPPSPLDTLRARIRRFQLIVGMGFISLVLGSIFSSALQVRMMSRLSQLEPPVLAWTVDELIRRLWVLAVLPGLCYAAARILPLRTWPTAAGAALTGQVILSLITLLSSGVEGLVGNVPGLVAQVVTLAVGIALAGSAVKAGRRAAEKTEAEAQKKAALKKDEYEQFRQEAERLAQRPAAEPTPSSATDAAAPPPDPKPPEPGQGA